MKMNLFKIIGVLFGFSAFLSTNVYAGAEGQNDEVSCTGACNLPVTYIKPKDGGAGSNQPVAPIGTSTDTVDGDG